MREFFPDLVGNGEAKARLGSSVLRGTLPHAFIFVGAEGSGKTTLATSLAAALCCENKNDPRHTLPCRICNTCRRIREGQHADVHYIRRDPKKMSIGVDEIHAMKSDVILSSTESEHRIYIITEAERLTAQAQNAMLTVLEEPPPNVVIIMLASEADKILTTIKSRAQTVAMQRFSNADLEKIVKERSEKARGLALSDKAALQGIIMASDGRIGRALLLLSDGKNSKETEERRATAERIVSALCKKASYAELYAATKELPTGRVEFKEALEEISSAVRDLILLHYDKDSPLAFFTDRTAATELSESISHKRLLSVFDLLLDILRDNAMNANIGAQLAKLAAKIKLI